MTDRTFDWCAGHNHDQYHALCVGQWTTPFGVVHTCACPNHANDPEDD